MALESTDVQNVRRTGLQKQRQEALAKVVCQQFYQSDRVKRFHRALLQTEALKELDDQMKAKMNMVRAAKEETRRFMAAVRCNELVALEQEREKARRKKAKKKAFKEFLVEQIEEQEQRRMRKAEKAKEVEERERLCAQYERERMLLIEQKKERMMQMRTAHAEHLQAMSTIQASEAEKREKQEERRRLFDTERERRMTGRQEKREEGRRVAQRYKSTVAEQLAAGMRERAGREERLNAKMLADSLAKREAERERESAELEGRRRSMREAIAAHREGKRRARERQAGEEARAGRDFLNARKAQDLLWVEGQRLGARAEAERRAAADDFLRRQMAEGRARERLAEEGRAEAHCRYSELVAEEEEQYQRYTGGVIRAAAGANRNTIPLLVAARHGMWTGVGPIYGGLRSNYLVPGAGHDRIPDYVGTTTGDLRRLYGTEGGQSANRLNFIW